MRRGSRANLELTSCAVSILLFVMAGLGGLPKVALVGLGVLALVAVATYLGGAHRIAQAMHRRFGRELHSMLRDAEVDAVMIAFRSVLADLDRLLAQPPRDTRYGALAAFGYARQQLKTYNAEFRDIAVHAVRQAQIVLSVPPEVIRSAERPRSVADLEYLRGWLRERTENMSAV